MECRSEYTSRNQDILMSNRIISKIGFQEYIVIQYTYDTSLIRVVYKAIKYGQYSLYLLYKYIFAL